MNTATMQAGKSASVACPPVVNIASRLTAIARRFPDKPAVIWCDGHDASGRACYRNRSFSELEVEVVRLASGLSAAGIARGMRTILFVRPGFEFFALVFALFRIGAVVVMVDPGMGRRAMARCLAPLEAEAFIGVPISHAFRRLYARSFRRIRVAVTVGRRLGWGGWTLDRIRLADAPPIEMADTGADNEAAILFTSGSTGPAKGVVYTHGVFDAQVRYLESQFGYGADEIDLPTFPLFALFDAALGMTAVMARMDFSRPGQVDPRRIVAPIRDLNVTHMFGSPALLEWVAGFGVEHSVKLPSVRRVMTAGAPVSPAMLAHMHELLDESAEIYTPYGATEALPVASIGSREILGETARQTQQGSGTCVGLPMPGLDVKVIRISDEPIERWSPSLLVPNGQIGEIVVRGPVVTRSYAANPAATRAAKIADGDTIWHRMGDVGYVDAEHRLWFCGRKAHRVVTGDGTLFSVCTEAIFNQHEAVRRSALVGVGKAGQKRPVICIELEPRHRRDNRSKLTEQLLESGASSAVSQPVRTVLFHRAFPVDVRHNAKIDREALAIWAGNHEG